MKYGLNLRVPPSQQKKQPARPPLPTDLGFNDDDEDDVEKEISRHASKNKSLRDIEEQHKKALEEDPSVFDYDGVYDEMKEKAVRPVVQDRQERKPRYIQALMEKAKVREREHEIVYERKLAKERSKEDHLYADKDKFVTSAYKKKLAEQAKWLEEERLRQLREEKEDITRKGGDMSEFYFNLSKNVAFGARDAESKKPGKLREGEEPIGAEESESRKPDKQEESSSRISEERPPSKADLTERKEGTASTERSEAKPDPNSSSKQEHQDLLDNSSRHDQPREDHHKRNQDALAAAKERFLARKKTKLNVG